MVYLPPSVDGADLPLFEGIEPVSTIDLGGAEIVSWFTQAGLALVITGADELTVVDYSSGFEDPSVLQILSLPGNAQSVAVNEDGLVAVAVADETNGNAGSVVFYEIRTSSEKPELVARGSVGVGNLPDSLAFTPDGKQIVVANEGEPDVFYGTANGTDPPGSISIIKVNRGRPDRSNVRSLDFSRFDAEELLDDGIRLSGINPSPEFDLEPEYVSISPDGRTAYVTLQENNAVAVVNLRNKKITEIRSLGVKDWALDENNYIPVDTSDRDGGFNSGYRDITTLRMSDGIDAFEVNGEMYTITADEGDGRVRPDDINFEAESEPGTEVTYYVYDTPQSDSDATVVEDPLRGGSLYVTTTDEGDELYSFEAKDGDEYFLTSEGAFEDDEFYSDEVRTKEYAPGGDYDNPALYDNLVVQEAEGEGRLKTLKDLTVDADEITGFGGRSFSIFNHEGQLVFDSGNWLDEIAAAINFNDDRRNDDKGVEPESVIAVSLAGDVYAFVALERPFNQEDPDELGSIIPVFRITDPSDPEYVALLRSDTSLSPEGLAFAQATESSGHLLAAHEESGTLAAFFFDAADLPQPVLA